jgi:Fic family protein
MMLMPVMLTGCDSARESECAPERFGRAERLVAIAAAHHRLLWIHPFADGNGRVARLLSHALLRRAGVGYGPRPKGSGTLSRVTSLKNFRGFAS